MLKLCLSLLLSAGFIFQWILLWLIFSNFIWFLLIWSFFFQRFINKCANSFFLHHRIPLWSTMPSFLCRTKREKTITWNDLMLTFMEIQGIYIEFLGKSHCHWTEGSGSKKETYTGTEIYLDERQYLLGDRTGECYSSFCYMCFDMAVSTRFWACNMKFGLSAFFTKFS